MFWLSKHRCSSGLIDDVVDCLLMFEFPDIGFAFTFNRAFESAEIAASAICVFVSRFLSLRPVRPRCVSRSRGNRNFQTQDA